MLEYALKAVLYGPEDARAHNALGNALTVAGSTSLWMYATLEARNQDPLYLIPSLNALFQLGTL